jgi:hypothetical protein
MEALSDGLRVELRPWGINVIGPRASYLSTLDLWLTKELMRAITSCRW